MTPKTLLVVGSGPGGYAAALHAASHGLLVTLVDDQPLGGTCVNRGCIPSKFLLSKAKQLADAQKLRESGIYLRLERLQLNEVLAQKSHVVETLRQRIQRAIKTSKISFLAGHASFVSAQEMEVRALDGTATRVQADVILLATGSTPTMPAFFPSHPSIYNSTTIFSLTQLPAHLIVVGGGYIGSELACAFQGLGSKVTLIERESRLLPAQPEFEAAAGVLQRAFEKRGMTVWTRTRVETVEPLSDDRLQLTCSNNETIEGNAVLLALGRTPSVQDLGLEAAGLSLENNRLWVDAVGRTRVASVFAIGDMVSALPLAHTAASEGERAVEALLGRTTALDYTRLPRVVYTWPEAAAIGWTETQAREAGLSARVDRYHMAASTKALTEQETEGFWAVVSETSSGKILGAQIVGSHATELIHLFALSLQAGLTLNDVSRTLFAHPTLAEGFSDLSRRAMRSAAQSRAQ